MKEISDIYLAAAFMSYGGSLDNINRSNPRHKTFTFSTDGIKRIWVKNDDESIEEVFDPDSDRVVTAFAEDILMFPPEYPSCVRYIKALIHDD